MLSPYFVLILMYVQGDHGIIWIDLLRFVSKVIGFEKKYQTMREVCIVVHLEAL